MKKILLLPTLLLISYTSFSQLTKGALLLEGGVNLNFTTSDDEYDDSSTSESKNRQFSLRPALGIMLSEKWMLGAGIGYTYQYGFSEYEGFYDQTSEDKSNEVSLSVFLRRYAQLNEKLYFTTTLEAAGGLGTIHTEQQVAAAEPTKSTDDTYEASISAIPGLAYFISEKWAVTGTIGEVYANFNWRKSEDDDSKSFRASTGLNFRLNTFSLGVQYFLRNGAK